MQRQEEGPFRLKGLGDGNLLFLCAGGSCDVCTLFFFSRCFVHHFFSLSLLMFDVLEAPVCARVMDPRLRLGNGPLQWGCVWAVSWHTVTAVTLLQSFVKLQ